LVQPASKAGTSGDSAEESVNSPLFRTGTFTMPTATRASASFTFPSYIEEPIIVYPGAIVCLLQIIASIPKMVDEQVGTTKIKFVFFHNSMILVFKSITILFNVNIKKFIKIRSKFANHGNLWIFSTYSIHM
jgi:hypothetical protein